MLNIICIYIYIYTYTYIYIYIHIYMIADEVVEEVLPPLVLRQPDEHGDTVEEAALGA